MSDTHRSLHIVMLAAENDALPGGKVGGIGDVVRDIPGALAALGCRVTVVLPSYGVFQTLPDAEYRCDVFASFRGRQERLELHAFPEDAFPRREPGRGKRADRSDGKPSTQGGSVQQLILHHPLFAAGGKGRIYCNDTPDQPFATDASKFALFSRAAMSAIANGSINGVDVLHLHDWHAALAVVLQKYDSSLHGIRDIPTVFSIHNLALQGVRPFAMHPSSFEAWFPHLWYEHAVLADPRWPDCVNPVAAAIRLADRVHAVSPTYAAEILLPNDPARGFHGGEGLEGDLANAAAENRLVGIINGIAYDSPPTADTSSTSRRKARRRGRASGSAAAPGNGVPPTRTSVTTRKRLPWPQFMHGLADAMLAPMCRQGDTIRGVDYLAHQRLLSLARGQRPRHVLTSVGRLTDQKFALMLTPLDDGSVPLARLSAQLGNDGLCLILGSGDEQLERQTASIAARHDNIVFISLYADAIAELLFTEGDLFLMPSSFEPCGISQMLAMRAGQPCLVHDVGGLHDTIDDGVDGFAFRGDSIQAQSTAMLARLDDILDLRRSRAAEYRRIVDAARRRRFTWRDSAARYIKELYKSDE
ncbi:MAG: glycogen synthase [Gammaproteobacteria bacterium]|nr:MAG: glycogen synthase [Gammaproteobacteria bacterium]PIE37254.1 MAG: glycogen synthase [Gammaproteobacteria bacterium]